jgi:uncharacterized protein YaeQ
VAPNATIYQFAVDLSDVDRGVYEQLDLRIARHPSETLRYVLTRLFAYCLSYEPGIAFSKDGIASTDEPPLAVRDATGLLSAWIEVGAPSADRLHKALKAAPRVELYSAAPLEQLRREAAARAIHKLDSLAVWLLAPAFLDALAELVEKRTTLQLTRTDESLYVTVHGRTLESALERASLAPEE